MASTGRLEKANPLSSPDFHLLPQPVWPPGQAGFFVINHPPMNTCNTCQYWYQWKNKTIDNKTFTSNMGTCRMVVMWWDVTEWLDEPPFTREITPKYKKQRAFVQDASDYSASLYTRQDFGCIDHKPRSTNHESRTTDHG